MNVSNIEEDLTIEGNIKSDQGTVEVKGKIIGDVAAKSVKVHQGGAIDGAVSAGTVTIEGAQTGSLTCGALTLAGTADVKADVKADTMQTDSGARIKGSIEITGKKTG